MTTVIVDQKEREKRSLNVIIGGMSVIKDSSPNKQAKEDNNTMRKNKCN